MNSTILQKQTERTRSDDLDEEALAIERAKQGVRMRRLQAAQALAARMQIAPDGSVVFVRFTRSQRIEHITLIASFTLLAITGLLQRYSQFFLVQVTINYGFGGIDALRTLHHLAAIVFVALSLYHLKEILDTWFVKRELGSMWPRMSDFRALYQMVKYNLNLIQEKPAFDRFSVEEKLEYWALLWGGVVMILTGFIQWFPVLFTRFLPGSTIPVSRSVHSWEALLATLAILTWHTYHVVIKERNTSMFTGTMTEREMKEEHPLEYRRIQSARRFLAKVAGENGDIEVKSE